MARTKNPEITESEILELLYEYNPWWQNRVTPKYFQSFKRSDFYKAKDRLCEQTILAIIGPRRVGKTVMIYQLIDELLKQTSGNNILFISLDHPAVQITNDLNKIFKIYLTSIVKKSFGNLTDRIYIFLDEIQSFPKWELELKSLYDLKYNIKFILTGSSSVNIIEGSSEALVGRIHPQIMLPIKFRDYLRFKITDEVFLESIKTISKRLRNALTDSLLNKDSDIFYECIKSELMNLVPYKNKILLELNSYFLCGGYPQIVFNGSEKAKEYLGDYISLTLQKDIRKLFRFKNTESLEKVFYLICKSAPHIVNKQKIYDTIGIDKNTLNSYLSALQSTFLISENNFFSNNAHSSLRREKKIYPIDIGIRNLYANHLNEKIFTDGKEMGDIAEIVTTTHTNKLIFNIEGIKNKNAYYWREGGQGQEVDIVVNLFSEILPIEVKYQTTIGNSDLNGIRKFNRKFKSKMSLVITKDTLEKKDTIVLIPAWIYLIMC